MQCPLGDLFDNFLQSLVLLFVLQFSSFPNDVSWNIFDQQDLTEDLIVYSQGKNLGWTFS